MMVDYLIVGSGLTGSTIARLLSDHGREVVVLERRQHVGGNVHDHPHASGIRIHTYGPHYFRCSSQRIWEFVQRFSSFYPYEPVIHAEGDGDVQDWPINRSLFDRYPGWESRRSTAPALNFEEACLQKMPRPVYHRFVEQYTKRQWGVSPRTLSPALASRVRINGIHQSRLTPFARFQGLPRDGYATMMRKMLAGIPVELGIDFLQERSHFQARKMLIFTGPVDEFFGFDFGRLSYRGQRREHWFLPDIQLFQGCGQVNHSLAREGEPIRTIEWKHLHPDADRRLLNGTVITNEFPYAPVNPNDYEYPFPDQRNQRLYQAYAKRAKAVPKLYVCGRLGDYRYFDMDQAIARAMMIAERLCGVPVKGIRFSN